MHSDWRINNCHLILSKNLKDYKEGKNKKRKMNIEYEILHVLKHIFFNLTIKCYI